MKIQKLCDIPDYQLCCGCGLCAFLHPEKIQMVDVPAYGRRPKFIGKGTRDETFQLTLGVCPGRGLSHSQKTLQLPGLIASLTEQWGPVLNVWEGYSADHDIRFNASSGGAMSALSLYCLERESMYGVLHVASDKETPYLNTTVFSRTKESLLAASGSRYSPASPCEGLQNIENAPAPCVFLGKPCDVAALYNVLKLKPALTEKIGLTIACFCAGTPSTDGTLEMLRQMGIDSQDKLSELRYRGQGWPGKTVAVYHDSNNILKHCDLTYEQAWGNILQKYRQWRCYICPDHTGEFADIAIGDPWYKPIKEGSQGQSLILARTAKGRRIVERAIAAGYLVAEKVDKSLLSASQENLLKARARLWGQMIALKLLQAPVPVYEGFCLFSTWKTHLTYRQKIQSILGTIKRIYSKDIKKRMDGVLR